MKYLGEKRKKFSYEMFESFEALAGYGNAFREEIVFNCSINVSRFGIPMILVQLMSW